MILTAIALGFLILSGAYLLASVKALRRKEPVTLLARSALAGVFMVFGLVLLLGFISLRGYQAFIHEALVATVQIVPLENQIFLANFKFADGTYQEFKVQGDELMVDAYVLKWKPLANTLGIHTSFQLARISGRYRDYQDEVLKKRSVFKLNQQNAYDLFKMRNQFSSLTFLVDAEYGSASFVPAKQGEYMLVISTTGLLFRELKV